MKGCGRRLNNKIYRERVDMRLRGWLLTVVIIAITLTGAGAVGAQDGKAKLDNELFKAIGEKEAGDVRKLLKAGANPNASEEKGRTALMHAGDKDDSDVVEALIKAGANVKAVDAEGRTPLMYSKSVDVVKLMVKAGADVNARDKEGNTVLISLIKSKNANAEMVEALIAAGHDVTVKNKQGLTALIAATDRLKFDIAKLLVPELIKRKYKDKAEFTKAMANVIFLAIDVELFDLLVAAGADVKEVVKNNPNVLFGLMLQAEILHRLLNAGVDVNVKGAKGKTPLMNAAGLSGPATVELFLAAGADVNAVDDEGRTVLNYAMASPFNKIVVPLLVKNGANVNGRGKEGRTALMEAADNGKTEFVKLFLEAGGDVNMKDNNGQTALMLALSASYIETINLLIKAGADIDVQDANGQTALMLAIDKWPSENSVKTLLEAGARHDIKDNNGDTALKIARRDARDDLAQLLKAAGAEE